MKLWRRWAWAVGWAGLIFLLSAAPLASGQTLPANLDKVGHLVLYGMLGFLMLRAASVTRSLAEHAPVWSIVLCALYAASDELHQAFVRGRDCSLWDWAADVVGAVAAVIIASRRQSRALTRDTARPKPR